MSASFASLKQSYNTYNLFDAAALYRSLGWDEVVDKPEPPS